jgi:hypothetical protein
MIRLFYRIRAAFTMVTFSAAVGGYAGILTATELDIDREQALIRRSQRALMAGLAVELVLNTLLDVPESHISRAMERGDTVIADRIRTRFELISAVVCALIEDLETRGFDLVHLEK